MGEKTYICIDLKSFYASVECIARGLDPFKACLVVADPSRGERSICLAVSPAMKAKGVPGRCRVYEIPPGIDYIMAPPRMQEYINVSARIYSVYLRYVAAEDIHVYSIDEVFMDVTNYLGTYKLSPHELAMKIILEVLATTGITATAGIGTNLYLCKIAMDIVAKHIPPDKNGVRIAQLDEMTYRQQLWSHRPITDFWRISTGTANRLQSKGITTMRGVATCPEDSLYHEFGIDAELLTDDQLRSILRRMGYAYTDSMTREDLLAALDESLT